ncbi:MAG: endolytic transglycosylase MltG [Pseudomonadales bacterium]|nr:endolytic transglycosylase MltG [Pseudomonadales bacterium]
MIKKIIATFALLALFVVVGGYAYIKTAMVRSVALSHPVLLNVPKGSSLNSVGIQLAENGLIESTALFIAYARLIGQSQNIKAGEYQFGGMVSPVSILNQLIDGAVVFHSVTLVEGHRYTTLLQHLWSQGHIKATLKGKTEKEVIALLGVERNHLEGLLFPDTYQFTKGESDLSIIKRAYLRMKTVLAEEWFERQNDLPYQSAYDALVMASIVEKETGLGSERADIAGVFVRRLKKNMRLQTDPTVIYGLGEEFDGNLTRRHLKTKTPYNTYMNYGLPPSPIATPGRAAIHAALHPASGTTLYFVARGDGSHEFTSNFSDHNKAVVKFQKKRVKNYRSSPAPVSNKKSVNQ